MNFYELREPTAWAAPPSTWSSTNLDEVEECPRRWQLLRSRWGDFERFPVRPHPAAIEGQIVHDALDRLTRACGQRGNPVFGSAEFSEALSDADFFPSFARAVTDWQQRLSSHPRPGPVFRLRTSNEELANRAVRMFREQYKPVRHIAAQSVENPPGMLTDVKAILNQKRALSEVRLTHPKLPFLGVLDRVQLLGEGVEIVDFKTGKPSDKHRKQLLRYALLWWRKTGDIPAHVSAQYLDGAETWPVKQQMLEETETEIVEKLPSLTEALAAKPALANPGIGCHSCAAKARCSAGWAVNEEAAILESRGDLELIVQAIVGEYGFLAQSGSGTEISVVYETTVSKMVPKLDPGQAFRITNGILKEGRTQIEIKPWTEIYLI